jgi:hypothetical protein
MSKNNKTARQALEWVKEASEGPGGAMMIPLMVTYILKHFDENKKLDDELIIE